MERVISYVDGFNLYFGLKSVKLRKFYWLNIQALSESLLTSSQNLLSTKYFTARISSPPEKVIRQNTFIEALLTLHEFEIIFGKYQMDPRKCRHCNATDYIPHEKMTDVNIAVEMLSDAFQNRFDVALLISADSDLAPVVCAVKRLFPEKRIIAAFPPNRRSMQLRNCVDFAMDIWPSLLKKCIFPEEIIKPDGFKLVRPQLWK